MRYVIRFVAMSGHSITPSPALKGGEYLKAYDPEAYDGRGWADWTVDPKKALQFDDKLTPWQLWNTIPKRRPVRADGRPNKPLTAFTITIEPLEVS